METERNILSTDMRYAVSDTRSDGSCIYLGSRYDDYDYDEYIY
jgi:hypothetical protein